MANWILYLCSIHTHTHTHTHCSKHYTSKHIMQWLEEVQGGINESRMDAKRLSHIILRKWWTINLKIKANISKIKIISKLTYFQVTVIYLKFTRPVEFSFLYYRKIIKYMSTQYVISLVECSIWLLNQILVFLQLRKKIIKTLAHQFRTGFGRWFIKVKSVFSTMSYKNHNFGAFWVLE
jgi:hypothetical protein